MCCQSVRIRKAHTFVNQYASEKHTHRTYAVWFQWNNITLSSKSYFVWFAFRVHGTTPESPRNLLVLDLPKACVDGLQRDAAEHALTPADFRWTVGFAEIETSEGKETKEITETWQFEKEVKWTSKYIEIHGGLPFLEHLEDVVAAFLMFWRMKKIPGSFTRFSWRASFEKLLMDFWYLRVANLETCLRNNIFTQSVNTQDVVAARSWCRNVGLTCGPRSICIHTHGRNIKTPWKISLFVKLWFRIGQCQMLQKWSQNSSWWNIQQNTQTCTVLDFDYETDTLRVMRSYFTHFVGWPLSKHASWCNQFGLPWSICGFESFSRDMTFLARSAPWRRDAGGSPKGESSRKFGSEQLNALHNLSLRWDLFFKESILEESWSCPLSWMVGSGPEFLQGFSPLWKDSALKSFFFPVEIRKQKKTQLEFSIFNMTIFHAPPGPVIGGFCCLAAPPWLHRAWWRNAGEGLITKW